MTVPIDERNEAGDPGWDASTNRRPESRPLPVPAIPHIARLPRIPEMTVRRLSTYYRVLRTLEATGDAEPLSSDRMSDLTGFTAAQVRRDLAYFGNFGKRGVGYDIGESDQWKTFRLPSATKTSAWPSSPFQATKRKLSLMSWSPPASRGS